jgi:PAS domain-containing protein
VDDACIRSTFAAGLEVHEIRQCGYNSRMAATGQSIEQARQAQDVDAIPTLAWSARPDGSAEFLNRRWLDYTGLFAEEASIGAGLRLFTQKTATGSWIFGGTSASPLPWIYRKKISSTVFMTKPRIWTLVS